MAKSPSEVDKAIVEEFKITDDIELSPQEKAQFVKSQVDQYKQVIWRERVETMICQSQMLSDDKAIAQEAGTKNLQHQAMIKQFATAIRTLTTLLKEMEDGQASSNLTK